MQSFKRYANWSSIRSRHMEWVIFIIKFTKIFHFFKQKKRYFKNRVQMFENKTRIFKSQFEQLDGYFKMHDKDTTLDSQSK